MAQDRLIPKKSKIWYRPASAAEAGAWTEISGYGIEMTAMPKRDPIDVGGLSDYGGHREKGDPKDQLKISFFHSKLWSDFSALMATELAADGNTEFMWVTRGADAVSADNRCWRCKLKFTDLGNIGGAKNVPSKLDVTLDIEGVFQTSTSAAATPPADNTFSDYV